MVEASPVVSRKGSTYGVRIPEYIGDALRGAALARAEGKFQQSVDALSRVMAVVQAEPFGTPFTTRVQLALNLADALLESGDGPHARQLLLDEAGYCEQIVRLLTTDGTPDQRRSAAAGRLQIRDRLTQIELLERPAPEIVVDDWIQGEAASLAELRGRVILLEFWATWCRPCLEMFPHLAELHARYAARGLETLALTRYARVLDDGHVSAARTRERELVRTVIADRGLDGVRVGITLDGRTQSQYGAHGVPTLAVIGRDGRVRAILSGGAEDELDSLLLACLGEPAP